MRATWKPRPESCSVRRGRWGSRWRASDMAKAGKKYRKAAGEVEARLYPLDEAVKLVKKIAFAKFNETVEVSMRLGVDPKHADQMVRGTVVLPHGLGRSKKVIVIASGEKVKEARDAGADE